MGEINACAIGKAHDDDSIEAIVGRGSRGWGGVVVLPLFVAATQETPE